MSKQYMQIVNGRPYGEAMTEETLQKLVPNHDFATGAPSGYLEYEPTERPPLIRFQKVDITSLAIVDGKVRDTINVRWMTADEKAIAIELKRRAFVAQSGFESWTYDEAIDMFIPPFPVPNPVENGVYDWDEANQQWVLKEVRTVTPPAAGAQT